MPRYETFIPYVGAPSGWRIIHTKRKERYVFIREEFEALQPFCLNLNLNLNSLLVKRQIDNPSPGAVTEGN